jgi:tetratricopeptide (TPR) repeat protein
VGRDEALAKVEGLLTQSPQVNIAATVGLGGVGKTELALQFALKHRASFPGGRLWLNAQVPIAPQVVNFARVCLGLEVPEAEEQPLAWCCQRWPGEGAVLIVLDDVQDYGAIKPLLPSLTRFRVLLTSRKALLPQAQRLELQELRPKAALELLASFGLGPRLAAESKAAETLCTRLGYLPLGLELVGRYLEERPDLSLAELLCRLEAQQLKAQALLETNSEMTASRGVAAAFELSWEVLSEQSQALATLFGLFAAAPVEWSWVKDCLTEIETEGLETARKALLQLHLLKPSKTASQFQVHPLLRDFFAAKQRDLPAEDPLAQRFAQRMTEIAKTIPQTATVAVRQQVSVAIPHLEVVAAHWTKQLADDDKTWCCTGLARFYESLSQWSDAERCCRRSLEISEAELGDRHPLTANSLNNLGSLYESMGRYGEAEPLYRRSLEIYEAELGDRHPLTANSLNNLALLYSSMGRYGEAEPLYRRSLEIKEAELGDRHPDTAQSLNNLAALYDSMGRYGEAEPLYRRSLEIREAELGDRHPYTASSLNNLAGLYDSMGRYGEAEPLYRRSLEIWEAELGDRHPDTATSLNNLALFYSQTNRLPEAEQMMLRAVNIYETALGPDHPYTKESKADLNGIQQKMKRPS